MHTLEYTKISDYKIKLNKFKLQSKEITKALKE